MGGCAAPEESSDDDREMSEPELATTSLDKVVAQMGKRAPRDANGRPIDVSIAVRDLEGADVAHVNGNDALQSASAAKLFWVTAALEHSGASAVDSVARRVFTVSDNDAAGMAIDLAGGINAVNDYYRKAGMQRSALMHWSTGRSRVATNVPNALHPFNYMTALDATRFLENVESGEIVKNPAQRRILHEWMATAPDSGNSGGWLGNKLPASVRSKMLHKAGWIPPDNLNEIGILDPSNGHRYAITIMTSGGGGFAAKEEFVARTSCVVYRVMAKTPGLHCL